MTVKSTNPAYRLMLDSGCTSHKTFMENCVNKRKKCDQKVNLEYHSTVKAKSKGVRTFKWKGESGLDSVHLSNTLVIPDLFMSLLSIPALVHNNVGVMFLPGKAVLIDLEIDFDVLGQGHQDKYGLFIIADD